MNGLAFEELHQAIHAILNKKKYFSDVVMHEIKNLKARGSDELPHKNLSRQEYEIMIAFAMGKTRNQIVAERNLRYSSVSSVLSHIASKLCLENTNEIPAYCKKNHLTDDNP
jgi:DNA-binding NarL/FixJ family response regulator